MYALPLTITLLTVIALAHCGTLRQYSRDWLIPEPDPQVGAKRITAKSVFVAPSFSAENVRCGAGFRQDASGRCVKVVHVNQAAQLDFLLQRLNAMYGAPVVSHSEKQPLQVNVEIPVEPVNGSTSMETAGIYSHLSPPEGEVSIDLLSSIADQSTKDVKTSEENLAPQDPYGQSLLPESEENETDVIIMPNKEMFQMDEEPIVMLTDIETDNDEDATQNTPLDSNKSTNFEDLFDDDEDESGTVISEVAGVMAAVVKNESNVIKKETYQGKDSVQLINVSKIETQSVTAHQTNLTQLDLSYEDEVAQSVKIGNKTQFEDTTKGHRIVHNKIESDYIANMLHSENVKNNGTSSKVSETAAAQESTSILMSNAESIDPKAEATAANATTENSTYSFVAQDITTPNINTDTDTEYLDSDAEYMYPDVDLEVESDEDLLPDSVSVNIGITDSVPTEASAIESMFLSANNSVVTNSGEGSFDSASGDGDPNEHEYSGDSEDISVNFNQSVSLNSTNTSQKTDSENSYNVPSKKGTNFDEILSFSGEDVRTPSKTHSYVSGDNASHFESSSLIIGGDDVLKTSSSVHNVNNEAQNFPEKPQNDSEEVQQVVTSQHSVHVVYPQPIIQVLNVKQDSHGHRLGVANSNEPKTEPKETADLNSPPHQFHNLSPTPLQHHNSHPVSQVPLAENVPETPHQYNGYPYSAHPQNHPYNPHHQFHPYSHPHPQRPHQQSGYVRFPADHAQEYHRSHPHAHAHRQQVAGNGVRFPQEESRTNDKYSRWGTWDHDEGDRGADSQRPLWAAPENRRNYWRRSRPARRRPEISYY